MTTIDIDNLIDYKQAYSEVEQAKITGDSLLGLCPFHQDSHASFSVDLKTGKYKCFACGAEGNYISFVAGQRGISTQEAYRIILDEHHISMSDDGGVSILKKAKAEAGEAYTVAEYATEKNLPEEWLKAHWRLSEGKDRVGGYISIPYFNDKSEKQALRKRYPKDSSQRFAWQKGSAGNLLLYGEWLRKNIEDKGYVILCEGESDTQTLWFLGFPALGVPGASNFKAEWAKKLEGLKVYIHIEPDQGGQTFYSQLCKKLQAGEFLGEVFTFSCGPSGAKDPSELYIKLGKEAAEARLQLLLDEAKKVDLSATVVVEAIPGAPKNLIQPDGWIYSDKGISRIDPKTMQPTLICRTPIILTKRVRNELHEEKIEVSFKRDGVWETSLWPRDMIFKASTVTGLSVKGATVTSENAKDVVKFLQALEAENLEQLELIEATTHCGWQTRDRFLPGLGGDLVLDAPDTLAALATAYNRSGTLDGWIKDMTAQREKSVIFRLFLAAAFAAPLLNLYKCRNFMLYIWESSKGGKTAALKAALSAWGDPERLMVSFNSTVVSLERRAAFFCDLPMGIDERQSAGGNKQDFLERIVYMLGNGVGRGRGAKDGGLQETLTWRTIAISTGEEPLVCESSMSGVSTRMLEIFGKPFDDMEDAAEMHRIAGDNCGWAGPAVLQWVLDNRQMMDEVYESGLQAARYAFDGKDANYASMVALLAIADYSASRALWKACHNDAWADACKVILTLADGLKESTPEDVNVRAQKFVADWYQINRRCFDKDGSKGVQYGWEDASYIYVFPVALREALENERFSYRKTIKAFAANGILEVSRDGKFQVKARNKVTQEACRVVKINKLKLFGECNEDGMELLPDDEEVPF